MADNDLVFESTTDSPEQIAEGLGVVLAPDSGGQDGADATVEDPGSEPEGVEGAGDPDPAPVGEVTPQATRVTAPRPVVADKPKSPKPAPRSVNGAVAAARRESEAKLKVAEAERDAALARVRELAAAHPLDPQTQRPAAARVTTTIRPEDIPETHPELVAVQVEMTALGKKPVQGDFADFEEFEAKRDQWIEDRATLRSDLNAVRKDVARRETDAIATANRAAAETASAFEQSVSAAKVRHADYDDVMAHVRDDGITVGREIGHLLMESPHGGEVTYYLATHPAEVDRINTLSPARQLAAVVQIEDRLTATLGGRPGTPPRPTARTTRAPDPQVHLVGDLPSARTAKDLNDPSLSQAEYNRLRDQMDRESGRRLH